MKKIEILDCTLRDGGYINNWKFGQDIIQNIIHNLIDAHIDIVECGFIRNVDIDDDSSVYSNIDQISKVISPKSKNMIYAVMIEQHNYVADLISPCSEKTVDLIRLTFRRNEWEDAKITVKQLMEKGYKVCIQPVGTASYDDLFLIKLLQDVNELNPYAFYLVDTLGVMYTHEMRKFFYLIDNNLSKNISLGFHSHNNLQMSFANAQEIIRLNYDRAIIIDSSCYGMGRGVGNLATELIGDYINRNIEQRYSLTPILNIVDNYLMPIYAQKKWGYDLPYFLSAIFKCHPNYAAHLISKETLSIEKIEKILSLIPKEKRNEYNEFLIEKLYLEMQKFIIDDKNSYQKLNELLQGKEVVIIGSGLSIEMYKESVNEVIKGKVAIAVNFIPVNYKIDGIFISNDKRLGTMNLNMIERVFATSNLKDRIPNALFFDYSSLLGEGDGSDNAGAMLIRVLKNSRVKKIYLAGFDGFEMNPFVNYAISTLKKPLDYDAAKKKNEDISKQLSLALNGVAYEIITPTKYKISDI